MYIKKLIHYILFGNQFIAIAAVLLTASTFRIFNLDLLDQWPLLVLIYGATVFIYSFHAIITIKPRTGYQSLRINWISRNKGFMKYSSYLILAFCLIPVFSLKSTTLISLIPLFLFSLFYTIKIWVGDNSKSLKEIPFVKTFLVASVWSFITVFLPLLEAGMEFSGKVYIIYAERFFMILSMCIPFDIRDYFQDLKHKVLTFPLFSGLSGAKILSGFCLSIYFAISIVGETPGSPLMYAIPAIIFIILATPYKRDLYYNLFGDGLLFCYAFSVLFLIP